MHNSTYTQVGVQCFYESEVLNQSSALLMKFIAKNPHLCVGAKRYDQNPVTACSRETLYFILGRQTTMTEQEIIKAISKVKRIGGMTVN